MQPHSLSLCFLLHTIVSRKQDTDLNLLKNVKFIILFICVRERHHFTMCYRHVKQRAHVLPQNLRTPPQKKIDKAHLSPLALKKVSFKISKRLFMTSVPLLVLVTAI